MSETTKAWLVALTLALPAFRGQTLAGEGAPVDSKVTVSWQVELAGGAHARFKARVGEMVQLTRPDGTTIGMVPQLEADPTVVTFEIFEVKGDPQREKQTFRKLDDVKARAGIVTRSSKVKDLAITLTAVAVRPEKVGFWFRLSPEGCRASNGPCPENIPA